MYALLRLVVAAGLCTTAMSAALASAEQEATPTPSVEIPLRDADDQQVGSALFFEGPGGAVTIAVSVEGLEPGPHGIHIHETGACDPSGDTPFGSAGGHYNPTGAQHGGPPEMFGAMSTPSNSAGSRNVQAFGTPVATPEVLSTAQIRGTPEALQGHAGDLGNLAAPEEGMAEFAITTDRFTLADLDDQDGSALIIHADKDDLETDPSGESGARMVCGVVFPAPDDAATPEA